MSVFFICFIQFYYGDILKKLYPLFLAPVLFFSYVMAYRIPFIEAAISTLLIWTSGCIIAYCYINKRYIKIFYFLPPLIIFYPLFDINAEDQSWNDFLSGIITVRFFTIILNKRSKNIQLFSETVLLAGWLFIFIVPAAYFNFRYF